MQYAGSPRPDPLALCTLEAQEATAKGVYQLPHAVARAQFAEGLQFSAFHYACTHCSDTFVIASMINDCRHPSNIERDTQSTRTNTHIYSDISQMQTHIPRYPSVSPVSQSPGGVRG